QLERIFTIAIHQVVLQFSQARDLEGDVAGIGDYGGERDNQPQDQTWSWRPPRRKRAQHAPSIQCKGLKFHCVGSWSQLRVMEIRPKDFLPFTPIQISSQHLCLLL